MVDSHTSGTVGERSRQFEIKNELRKEEFQAMNVFYHLSIGYNFNFSEYGSVSGLYGGDNLHDF